VINEATNKMKNGRRVPSGCPTLLSQKQPTSAETNTTNNNNNNNNNNNKIKTKQRKQRRTYSAAQRFPLHKSDAKLYPDHWNIDFTLKKGQKSNSNPWSDVHAAGGHTTVLEAHGLRGGLFQFFICACSCANVFESTTRAPEPSALRSDDGSKLASSSAKRLCENDG